MEGDNGPWDGPGFDLGLTRIYHTLQSYDSKFYAFEQGTHAKNLDCSFGQSSLLQSKKHSISNLLAQDTISLFPLSDVIFSGMCPGEHIRGKRRWMLTPLWGKPQFITQSCIADRRLVTMSLMTVNKRNIIAFRESGGQHMGNNFFRELFQVSSRAMTAHKVPSSAAPYPQSS